MGNKRNLFIAIAVLVLAVGGWLYYRSEERAAAQSARELKLSGNVDVREVSLAFRGSDRLGELLVAEGDSVKKGQVLARLETKELRLTMAKTRAEIQAQESAVELLHNGTRPEEIHRAEEALNHVAGRVLGSVVPRNSAVLDVVNTHRIKRVLLHVRKHDEETGETVVAAVHGVVRSKDLLVARVREIALNVVEVLRGQSELLQVVCALHTTRRFTSSLHRRQKKTDQDTDDRDDDKKFNEGEGCTTHGSSGG